MNLLMKLIPRIHVGLYKMLGGKVVGHFGEAPILLLTTKGRKSGKTRTMPLLYFPEGNGYFIIASAGGSPKHPAWYLNVKATPSVKIQVGREIKRMTASDASAENYDCMWSLATSIYPAYEGYKKTTQGRKIPIVVLTP